MKAIVLSEEQCTWSLEGETFLCLLLRLGSFKRQTNATTSIYIIYVQCRYLMLQIGGVFFPEISLCCFPPPLTSSLNGCHF